MLPLIQLILAAGTKTNRDPFLAHMEQLQFSTVVDGSSRGGEIGTVKVFVRQWQEPEYVFEVVDGGGDEDISEGCVGVAGGE